MTGCPRCMPEDTARIPCKDEAATYGPELAAATGSATTAVGFAVFFVAYLSNAEDMRRGTRQPTAAIHARKRLCGVAASADGHLCILVTALSVLGIVSGCIKRPGQTQHVIIMM